MIQPAVVIKDLEKRFGDFMAVNRISLEVKPGEIYGFLGPNGAGKSTTIRMLCGILRPTSGTATVAGYDITGQSELVKTSIGYMSQKFSLYDDLTVEENIEFYSGIYCLASGKKKSRREWVIDMAGLTDHRGSLTATLSVGWKQRLALGCAIIHEPPIIFLDEPTSGVDPISRRRFWDLIYDLSGRGITIFVTTHYMDEAEYCDRIGLIYRGELIVTATPDELKHRHMHGEVLSVICDRPQDAMLAIDKVPGVRETALFGRGLHAVTDDAGQATIGIKKVLADKGFTLKTMESIIPSLEDVFVSLIEERDAQSDRSFSQ